MPATTVQRRFTPAKLMLGTCAVLIATIAGLLLGARGGLWQLPPAATAMLRHETALLDGPATAAIKPGAATISADQASASNAAPATTENPQPAAPAPAVADQLALAPTPTAAVAAPVQAPTAEPAAATAEPTAATAEPTAATAEPTAATAEPAAAAAEPPPSADEPAPAPATPPEPPPRAASAAAAPLSGDENSAAMPAGSANLLPLARARQKAGDLAGAESLLRRALAIDPDDHHAIEALVRVLIDQRRGSEALRYAEEIVHKRPKRASYRVLDGDAKLLTGDQAGAESAWREALAMEPGNREAKRRLASLP
jgi:hypothetical protein